MSLATASSVLRDHFYVAHLVLIPPAIELQHVIPSNHVASECTIVLKLCQELWTPIVHFVANRILPDMVLI